MFGVFIFWHFCFVGKYYYGEINSEMVKQETDCMD